MGETPVSRTFGRRDLVSAYLSARRHRQAAEELRDFHQRRYRALASALGCDLDTGPEHGGQPAARHLIRSTIESFEAVGTPFDGLMEASAQIAALYEKHGAVLSDTADLLRFQHKALLVDLVELAYGLGPDRVVTEDELRAAGFDLDTREPDPLDFW